MENNKFESIETICGKEKCESYLALVEELAQVRLLTKKLDTVIESSYDGIYITDGKGVTTRINKAYERITSIEPETILGKPIQGLVDQGIISKACSLLVIETKSVQTIQQTLASGKVILVTGTPIFDDLGNIEMVVNNVRDITELIQLKEALQEQERKADFFNEELERLRKKLLRKPQIYSQNDAMKKLVTTAKRVAAHDTTVLLYGETGVGKEVFAEYMHRHSSRRKKKLVKINCGAIPETLIESELFGYDKGAFTGANQQGKIGLFEEADGGTLFLDEIGELSPNVQAKLLRVLQEHEIQRLGSVETKKIDVRIIAATHQDLLKMAEKGQFRMDLYYRLSIIPLSIPPLRERKEDLHLLINDFLDHLNATYAQQKKLSKAAYEALFNYDWPGNIRELKNVIERIFVLSSDALIEASALPFSNAQLEGDSRNESFGINQHEGIQLQLTEDLSLKKAVETLEAQMIQNAYLQYGNVRDAAKSLGIDASTFVRKRQRMKDLKE